MSEINPSVLMSVERMFSLTTCAEVSEYVWVRCECGYKLFRFKAEPHRGVVTVETKCPQCSRIGEYTVRYPHLT